MTTRALPTRRSTIALGRAIADVLRPSDLLLLSGDLGAGKTFLARALLRALGVPSEIAIASPTFTLVAEYETPRGVVLHADLYRLREGAREGVAREIRRLDLAERRSEGAVVIVEWGEGYEHELGGPAELVVALAHEARGRSARIDGTRAGLLRAR